MFIGAFLYSSKRELPETSEEAALHTGKVHNISAARHHCPSIRAGVWANCRAIDQSKCLGLSLGVGSGVA